MSFSSGQKQLREKWVSLKRGCTVLQKCEIDNCQCDWVEGGGGMGGENVNSPYQTMLLQKVLHLSRFGRYMHEIGFQLVCNRAALMLHRQWVWASSGPTLEGHEAG